MESEPPAWEDEAFFAALDDLEQQVEVVVRREARRLELAERSPAEFRHPVLSCA